MKLATISYQNETKVGRISDDGENIYLFDLAPAAAARGVLSLIERLGLGESLPSTGNKPLALSRVRLLSPLPQPRRNIWCVGRNYHAHAKELDASVFKDNDKNPESWPIVFTKVPECVVGPYDDVSLPTGVSEQIDYEAELAVVIGKGGKNISREKALSHIYGYTVLNDVTARDVQIRHQQWDLGKSFDTFCPMGPWIATADEFDGTKTRIRCWVNGELRQDGMTDNFIFDIPSLIETISRGITLYPGDVIATGTPAGVGLGMKPPTFLRSGDVVRVEIDGLGHIENCFVA